jgi:uncharacterized membrane protein
MDTNRDLDDVEALKKLARLREQGILTEEEFQKKKANILGPVDISEKPQNVVKPVQKNIPTYQTQTHTDIGFSVMTTTLETAPGESVETILKISNEGAIVDRFQIRVEGLDPTWWTLTVPSLALFPRDRGECKLIIRPPKDAEARAGVYSFHMKVVSEAEPDVERKTEAVLTVLGFIVWEVEMSPTIVVGRRGKYHINFHNSGNTDMVMTLQGKDPEEALIFSFSQEKLTIPAGGSASTELTIYPKQGEKGRTYVFQVLCKRPTPSKEVRDLNGRLVYSWKHRSLWWWILVAIGIILLIIILGWLIQYFATV